MKETLNCFLSKSDLSLQEDLSSLIGPLTKMESHPQEIRALR